MCPDLIGIHTEFTESILQLVVNIGAFLPDSGSSCAYYYNVTGLDVTFTLKHAESFANYTANSTAYHCTPQFF